MLNKFKQICWSKFRLCVFEENPNTYLVDNDSDQSHNCAQIWFTYFQTGLGFQVCNNRNVKPNFANVKIASWDSYVIIPMINTEEPKLQICQMCTA